MKQFDMRGKVTLVTGGAGWLGQAFCDALAEAGSTVVVSSRDFSRAEGVASKLASPAGQSHVAVALDHLDEASINAGFAEALKLTSRIDVLVNNGLELLGKDWTNVTLDEFAWHQRNNAGYFILARTLRDHVVHRKASGAVINVGSMYGKVASYPSAYEEACPASPVAYHALKGGTLQMTRHLAVYWAKDNVRVNSLSPGPFPNPASAPAELLSRLAEKSPMGRMGRPEELKGAIVFLASDASSYVTGQDLMVDGGWTAW